VLTGALIWYRALPSRGHTGGHTGSEIGGPISAPTLYVWGEHDAFLGRRAAELTEQFVRGPYAFHALAAGHWLQDLPETAQLLLAHLAAHPRS
jgi:pimeloyl-ACP methyl ester carboxylesterase